MEPNRPRVRFACDGPSMVKVSPAYEADVNVIVARYVKTGDARIFNAQPGAFGDVSDVGSYHECVNMVHQSREEFMTLPAKVRAKFRNDPAELVDAMGDPSRVEELRELGVFERLAAAAAGTPTIGSSIAGAAGAVVSPATALGGSPGTIVPKAP